MIFSILFIIDRVLVRLNQLFIALGITCSVTPNIKNSIEDKYCTQ